MTSEQVRETFLNFFAKRDHLIIPQASLVPEYDPTLLFTNSGMAPLKPFFLGLKPPPSERLVDIQPCLRTEDLDNIGDPNHHTFFEMMGSWSIGGYGKREAVEFAWLLLTDKNEGFGFDPKQLFATVFAGNEYLPADDETIKYWVGAGLPMKRVLSRPASENLWVSGPTGPCGPCTEVLYDRGLQFACGPNCGPTCGCGRFYEIWNAGVFMQYNRTGENQYEKLPFLSVDTGAGLDRITAILQNTASNYETDLFFPLIQTIETIAEKTYGQDPSLTKAFRIIADHVRAITFIAAEGIVPSNVERGYVLRRLIRRSLERAEELEIHGHFLGQLVEKVIERYGDIYPNLRNAKASIIETVMAEEKVFAHTLERGKRELEKMGEKIDAFKLFDTFGLPLSFTLAEAKKLGRTVDTEMFEQQMSQQQDRARNAARKESYEPEKIKTAHTGAHLLNAALRRILGTSIHQAGQKISPNRIRHDFTFDRKLTPEELNKVEDMVNEQIKKDLPVKTEETTFEKAVLSGAEAMFEEKYRKVDVVTLYSIGDFSLELCGGPHAASSGQLTRFRIDKEEAVGRGVRRIYATVEG